MSQLRSRRPPLAPLALVGMHLLGGAFVPAVSAHEGPPVPILMDEPAVGHVVSVWADPDIGQARFFVVVETQSGDPPREAPQIFVWVEPVSGRLDRVSYQASRRAVRNQLQLEAQPYFDQRDTWSVGIRLTNPGGESHELTTEIESTPPGYGIWDLAIYLFPFVLLGSMWMIAMARRRRLLLEQVPATTSGLREAGYADRLVESSQGGES